MKKMEIIKFKETNKFIKEYLSKEITKKPSCVDYENPVGECSIISTKRNNMIIQVDQNYYGVVFTPGDILKMMTWLVGQEKHLTELISKTSCPPGMKFDKDSNRCIIDEEEIITN